MKNFIIAFCVFLVWSFFGLWLYFWLQEDPSQLQSTNVRLIENTSIATDSLKNDTKMLKNEVNDTVAPDILLNTDTSLLAYTIDGDILFRYEDNFSITKNSPLVFIPTAAQDFKYKLNTYFLEHPNTELHITSQYSAEENYTTPNIGVQRAEEIKNILVDTGIPVANIVIKPHITPIVFDEEGKYSKAFRFEFQTLNQARVAAIKNDIPETKTIYPRFSISGVQRSPELAQLLEEVKLALDNNPNLSLEVVGHTDNVGNAIDNYRRGLEFARQVRWYLIAKGPISRHRIKASSKGESEAIASNNTEKGRTLNQRIEVKFTE